MLSEIEFSIKQIENSFRKKLIKSLYEVLKTKVIDGQIIANENDGIEPEAYNGMANQLQW